MICLSHEARDVERPHSRDPEERVMIAFDDATDTVHDLFDTAASVGFDAVLTLSAFDTPSHAAKRTGVLMTVSRHYQQATRRVGGR